MNTSLEEIEKAHQALAKARNSILARKRMAGLVLEALKTVAHHQKVTSRVTDAVKKHIGPPYHCVINASSLEVWGGDIDYNNRFVVYYNDGLSNLIRLAAEATDEKHWDTAEINKTAENLEMVDEFLRRGLQLQAEIADAMPALHYLKDVRNFSKIYELKRVYIK